MLRQPFGVLRDGEPIELVPLRNAIRTGIVVDDARVALGMISEYEEREAAIFSGLPWMEWLNEDARERAGTVAHMRLHYQISSHTSDAVQRVHEQQRKRKAKQQ